MTTTRTTHFSDTKEFHDLVSNFESINKSERLDKEDKSYRKQGRFYQDGNVNMKFTQFMHGYMMARSVYMNQGSPSQQAENGSKILEQAVF